jgi:glycosyltransferase involved in cell wall biosynthesis
MQEGLVSIITPLYNGQRFIAKTIESVQAQTYVDWEMLIINDGSTDTSAEIVETFSADDDRIKLFSQPNGGSAAARNNGIRRAEGQYIALLDADDVWEPFFLESQLELMNKTNSLLVYGSHKRIDENDNECLAPYIAPVKVGYTDLLKTCSISCLTGVYDASVHGKVYLNENFKSLRDDHIYWLEIIKKTKVAYGNQQVIASYRMLGNSTSRNKKKVIMPQFKVYYEVEKLGLIKSVYYLINWALNGFLKYRK